MSANKVHNDNDDDDQKENLQTSPSPSWRSYFSVTCALDCANKWPQLAKESKIEKQFDCSNMAASINEFAHEAM